MDKSILIQYSDMKEEIKDLRRRIKKLDEEINKLTIVSDSVKGTRRDGTIGSIKITGFPYPAYRRKKDLLARRRERLSELETQLLKLTNQVDEYIESIEKSELRIMFRLYYIDNLTWEMVAMKMNYMFPKRKISYTKDNCRIRHDRFLEKVS